MFLSRKPSAAVVAEFIASQRELQFTYSPKGATRADNSPAGFYVDHNRTKLGAGGETFQRAVAALRGWKQFDLGWVSIVPPDVAIEAGAVVAVRAHTFGVWSLNACRIVYVIDETEPLRRFGFAYGTLPEHVECGEERFTVEQHADGSVFYDIFAFSRPRQLLGKGKLAWKVEFAARWSALNIRFEAYGKDIMDSVRVNDWVSDVILNYAHPLHVKYEMFLDKGGKKISKSTGNVLTPQVWLRYGTPQSLLLLLYKRITGTRQIGTDDVATLMEEYDYYEDLYFGKKKEENEDRLSKIKGIYEYVNNLKTSDKSSQHVPYMLMVQQASFFSGADRIKKVFERLLKYKAVAELTPDLQQKIQLACNWSDDYISTDKFDVVLNDNEKAIVKNIVDNLETALAAEKNLDAEKIQQLIYETSKHHEVQPKKIFKLFYKMLINADSGPKLGGYISDLGLEKTRAILQSYVS